MVTQEAGIETQVTPEAILRVASGFMAAKHLFIASSVGLFAQLAERPLTLDELNDRLEISRPAARMLADAMVALELIELEDGHYRNRAAAQTFLAGVSAGPLAPLDPRKPADLRPLLRFWDQISYPAWLELETVVRTGQPHRLELDEEKTRIFSEGVEAITAPAAHALAHAYDFSRHRRVLDLGGGTGSFLKVIVDAYPSVSGTLFELPQVAEVARQHLGGSPEAERIGVIAGDIFQDPIPEGHDAVIVANVIHVFGQERNHELLKRVRSRVEAGARLLLVDFWTDVTHTRPVFAALMAGEFRAISGEGDVYSVEEMRAWLADTGLRFVEHVPLSGPAGLIVAEAS